MKQPLTMLRLYFHHIIPPYSSRDAPAIILSLLFIFAIAILVMVNSEKQTYEGRAQESQQARFVPDQVLVRFKDDAGQSQRDEALQGVQGHIDHAIEQIKVHVVKVPEGTVQKVVDALSHNPNIEFAEPDYIATFEEVLDDPYFSKELNMQKIQAPQAYDITHGSTSTLVADLDTGVDLTHPDLAARIVKSAVFTGETSNGQDNNGHGTKTTGLAAAIANNGVGVAGVAYNASILNGKICDSSGSCTYSAMASGITWAADNAARAINLSVGGLSDSSTLQNAINYAWNKNAVIVASAGNCGDGTPSYCNGQVNPRMYPGADNNVLSVGATNLDDTKTWYTEYGTWVDVAAPVGYNAGVTYTTLNGGGYGGGGNGTSFSTPQVTGLVALVAGQHPD